MSIVGSIVLGLPMALLMKKINLQMAIRGKEQMSLPPLAILRKNRHYPFTKAASPLPPPMQRALES